MRIGLIGTGRIGAMHARALRRQAAELVITDAAPGRAAELAGALGPGAVAVDSLDELHRHRPDGVVIAAATHAHAGLVHDALDRDVPVFCEKPVAPDVPGTREVLAHARASGTPLQVGFQRRFDAGYRAAREAVRSGRLGWLHTLRAVTADAEPPPAEYLPTSGGLFRDCGIHDLDVLRWVTGREIAAVFARGANRGAPFFAAAGDVDTCAALVELDDGTLATLSASRYNGAGHDVRLEVCGSAGALFVGHDERAPLPSAEPGISGPSGTPYRTFAERFAAAYEAELAAFAELAAGRRDNPCTAEDALEALHAAVACDRSREQGRRVEIGEIRDERS